MNTFAFVFPGQGSQATGMGRDLAAVYPEAQAVFDEADDVLGFSISTLCFEGPDVELRPTETAQPALLTCSIAAFRCLESRGFVPAAVAGHSLGEYSALVAAGSLPFADAVRLVRRRGELMAAAGKESPGAMAAVLGLDADKVAEICQSVDGVVVPANMNAPGQVVISGTVEGVKAASEAAKTAGAMRVIPLAVSGAFHSPLMQAAAEQLRNDLALAPFAHARIPVLANTTAAPVREPAEIREALVNQMACGVRWEEGVRTLHGLGINHFVEVGPGKVLSGLIRKIIPASFTYNVGDSAGVESLQANLAG